MARPRPRRCSSGRCCLERRVQSGTSGSSSRPRKSGRSGGGEPTSDPETAAAGGERIAGPNNQTTGLNNDRVATKKVLM